MQRIPRTLALTLGACVAVLQLACADDNEARFEYMAWVDHFDFARHFDTERPEGVAAILDHVAETGATTILWRNVAGSTVRYQSKEDSPHHDSRIDKRRVESTVPTFGWVRYGDAEPDLIATMVKMCKERGLRPGIHWPFEETHWWIFTIGRYNLEHPQFWGRTQDGKPWWGRVSIAYEPVVQHKLRLVDELLDRGVECLMLDFRRNGGWSPAVEYVPPITESYRKKYGEPPPADASDMRWVRHVCSFVNSFIRRLRDHVKQRAPDFELIIAVPKLAPISDDVMKSHLADWRTWVEQGWIDTLAAHTVMWDPEDPMRSTGECYRQILDFVDGRCNVLFPVRAYNHPFDRGMPAYQKATGKTQEQLARELAELAWGLGADGITMECVDYDNYKKPTRDVLNQLRTGSLRFVRKEAAE